MMMKYWSEIMKNKYIIFDLDDTLIQEVDYLKSAYKEIATTVDKELHLSLYEQMIVWYESNENVFQNIIVKHPQFHVNDLLDIYRTHLPTLHLNEGAKELLEYCKSKNFKIGLITDGRSTTQRNKIKSVGIDHLFDKVVISEEFGSSKPDLKNFQFFMTDKDCQYYYIANDTKKDFLAPNQLGWTSICLLDSGTNIHKQNFKLGKEYLPQFKINKLTYVQKLLLKNT